MQRVEAEDREPGLIEEVLLGLRDDLVASGQLYLDRYEAEIEHERGGVPLELAAVLGAAHEGERGWFWRLEPAQAQRLRVPRVTEDGKTPMALQLWAGLRIVNEAAVALERNYPQLLAAGDGALWWTAVCQVDLLGARAFQALARAAGGPESILELVQSDELPQRVGSLTGDAAARRAVLGALRVAAAELLGGPLPATPGQLVGAPDARFRKKVARGAAVLGVVQHLAQIAIGGGWLPLPSWGRPPDPPTP